MKQEALQRFDCCWRGRGTHYNIADYGALRDSPVNNRGFFLENVRDVRFQQVTVENHEGPAFYIVNGEEVEIINCRQETPPNPKCWRSRLK